ncbi:uncharacterized protein LOC121754311 [Salvia splendens]|uniref:uncharacterized protein LOC121754311 n=1 Tax=Salvia splendens TaxID=180675 RepID=UPI0011052ADA|nr:uncharacterized protein LOC121754311 [Salvia splendens]
MNKKAKKQNQFVRIITTPYRALCKARDFYVRNMLDCANSNAIGLQSSGQGGPALPRSFSTSSSASRDDDADYRELVRAASARTIGVNNLDAYIKQERKAKPGPPRALPPRSASVAMGRIDEERPSGFFGEDIKIGNFNKFDNSDRIVDRKSGLKYPRSKSDAVVVRTTLF